LNKKTESVPAARAILTPRGVERMQTGHLWIYRSDVAKVVHASTGDVVQVEDRRGKFLGSAHYGAESEITLRLLTDTQVAIDEAFWRERLLAAAKWREQIAADAECYRLVHAEGDLLPGLIIDRYQDVFVIQTLTRGMDQLKAMWVRILVDSFQPRLVIERNDAKVRGLEGLPMLSGILYRNEASAELQSCELTFLENGIKFSVEPLEGQKTGAFLDQRENRAAAMGYARGRGLDCFSFHGSFALHLARGCDHVTAIDISLPAIERARRIASLNAIENVEFVEGNVFDELHRLDDEGQKYETIVLDPPAFAKNRRAIDAALRGYKEINLRALKLLSRGGILITCSCSYHISEEMFLAVIAEAARDAHREVQIVERRTQGRDHPILLSVPQTGYLKCVILRAI
jgi:23S rRNA (cytosine1962-C5)-methyltransferase